jgi:hypothetical protein
MSDETKVNIIELKSYINIIQDKMEKKMFSISPFELRLVIAYIYFNFIKLKSKYFRLNSLSRCLEKAAKT